MYIINLSNGVNLENVHQNGDLFSVTGEMSREELEAGLGSVSIVGTPDMEYDLNKSGAYKHLKVGYWREVGTTKEFTLVSRSEQEMRELELEAKLEYVAMMTEVEL